MRKNSLVQILLSLLVLSGPAVNAWGLHIEFKPAAQIEDSVIRLGDVAHLSPEQDAGQYEGLELFRMRSNQTIQEYRTSTLRAYVQQHIGNTAKISWGGEDRIVVRRAGGELIDHQIMLDQIMQYLEEHFDHPSVSHVDFVPRKMPEPFVLPDPNWECTVRPSNQPLLSNRRFSLVFQSSTRTLRTVHVRGELRVGARVAVAGRNLSRGQTLARSDIELEERELSGRSEPIFELEEAVGKRVQNTLRSGTIIDAQNIARPHLVERRKPVTLIVRKGKMIISATGIAREDGAKMDRVCVENAQSGQEVYGRVVASDTVEVAF